MLLMTPGPVTVDQRILSALNQPVLAQYDPAFVAIYEETVAMLRTIFGIEGDAVILPGSGRLGVEAAIVSVIEPGNAVLNLTNGIFGNWMIEITRRCGGISTVIEAPWDFPIDPEEVRKHLTTGKYKAVTVVHSETSTGVRNPVEAIGELCQEFNTLFIVDAISSLCALPVNMQKMHIDLCVGSSQKAIGSLIGLSMVGINTRAWQMMERRTYPCQNFALDIGRWRTAFFERSGIHPGIFPVIPSTHLVYALNIASHLLLDEGLPERIHRIKVHARAVRAAVQALGLELFPQRASYSDSVTAVRTPFGMTDSEIVDMMQEEGILIGGSIFELRGQIFRIAHMGEQARRNHLLPTLLLLEKTLSRLGYKLSQGLIAGEAYLSALDSTGS